MTAAVLNDVRRVQIPAVAPLAPLPVVQTGNSSIAAAAGEKPFLPSRPKLEEPCYILDVVHLVQAIDGINTKQASSLKVEIESLQSERKQLEADIVLALKKHAEEVRLQETWGVWQTVAQYIASTASIVVGLALGSGLLIASGALGLLNRVLTETGGWQKIASFFTKSEETQRTIARAFDTGAFFLSFGMGMAGSFLAWQSGAWAAFNAGKAATEKAAQAINLASSAATLTARLGGSLSQRKILHFQAAHIQCDSLRTENDHAMQDALAQAKEMLELSETSSSVAKQILGDL